MAHWPTILGTLVDIIHLCFMIENAFGSLIGTIYLTTGKCKRLFFVNMGLMLTAAFFQATLIACPLTLLSEWLHKMDDPTFHMKGGFIQFYANNVFHLGVTEGHVNLMILSLSVIPTIFAVLLLLRYRPRRVETFRP